MADEKEAYDTAIEKIKKNLLQVGPALSAIDLSDAGLWTAVVGKTYQAGADPTAIRSYFGRFVSTLLGLPSNPGAGSIGTTNQAALDELTGRVSKIELSTSGLPSWKTTVEANITSLTSRVEALENRMKQSGPVANLIAMLQPLDGVRKKAAFNSL